MISRFWTLALVAVLALAAVAAHAQGKPPRRMALVIGNDGYQHVAKLQKAGNDAAAMARELKASGFEVVLARDLNYRAMVRTVEAFTSQLAGGDQVVVFFAGHGVQIRAGSYLLPVDIEAGSESEIEKTAYGLNDLTEKLGDAKAAFTLVLVDACRDNPLKANGRSIGATRGLSAVEPPKGQMVVYSASRGQQALDRLNDKDANPNGVFTREFIARMRQPGARIEDIVRDVQESVESLAKTVGHEQRPAIYNEARGSFYFVPPAPGQAQASRVAVAPPAAQQPSALPAPVPEPASPAAPAPAENQLVAAFRQSDVGKSSSPADVSAISRMLSLPAGEERQVNVNGFEAVKAFVAADPFFAGTGGTEKLAYDFFMVNGNMKMARTCQRNGNLYAATVNFGNGAVTGEGTNLLGGLIALEFNSSPRGYPGNVDSRIVQIKSVYGQPFPLTPGKRFGLSYVVFRRDGVGKLFGSNDSQASWQVSCGVSDQRARNPAIPEGATQVMCLSSMQGAQGIWQPVRRLYWDEPSGCLVDTQ